jgi:ATP-dependent protease ClpP protease subunit
MKFRILSFAVAIIAVVNAPAWGQVFQQGSMKFRLAFLDTADRGNIDWIVADGEITNETPNEFRQFLSFNKIKHGTKIEVYFNSLGGNIIGGLKLGEIIREFALGTRVARSAGASVVKRGKARK